MTKIKRVSPENQEGVIVDMTSEEQTQYDADVTRLAQEQTDREIERQAKIDLKASAKAKLIAGEAMTEEEANVLVGV
tara:strand:- start:76 stop:306 length:231 start_codon:yes stop_codon:yes gene_type:complete